jgi:hypothetical protein
MGLTARTHQISAVLSDGTDLMPQQVELRMAGTALGAALAVAAAVVLRATIPVMDAWPRHS